MQVLYANDFLALEERFLSLLKKEIKESSPTLVLVPSQASFMTEKLIMEKCSVRGLLNIEVLSFERLTERILGLAGGRALPVLSDTGYYMLIRDVLAKQKKQLRVLNPDQDEQLHRQVGELLISLKMEDITCDDVEEIGSHAEGNLGQKLSDIALTYRESEKQICGKTYDQRDLEGYATQKLTECDFLKDKNVILYGFDSFPRRRVRMLAEVEKQAKMTVLLMEAEDSELFASPWWNIMRIKELLETEGLSVNLEQVDEASRPDDIRHLVNNLYAHPAYKYGKTSENIQLLQMSNREEECRRVAEMILEDTCENGLSMQDIGIMSAAPESYAPLIKDIFSYSGIPFFLEQKRTVSDSVLGVFISSLLDILDSGRWKTQDLKRYIKCVLVSPDRKEAERFCAYIDEYGIKGGSLKKELVKGDEAGELEPVRKRIIEPLLALQNKQKNAPAIGANLIAFMREQNIEETLIKIADQADGYGLKAEARFLRQIYKETVTLLSQIDLFAAGESIRQIKTVIQTGLCDLQVAVIPPRMDEVVISDIAHSIYPSKKKTYILGVSDGILPPIPSEENLINEYEIEQIKEECENFPRMSKNFDDLKPRIRRSFISASKLVVTCNEEDGVVSPLIRRMEKIFEPLPILRINHTVIRTAAGSMENLARELRDRKDGQKPDQSLIPTYLEENRERLFMMKPALSYKNIPHPLQKETAKSLYGKQMKASISAMESYFACPYKHYIRYGLRPKEREYFEEDARAIGTYLHHLVDGFSKSLHKEKKDWATVEDGEIKKIMTRVAREYREEHNRGIFLNERYLFDEQQLVEEASLAASVVREQLKGTDVGIDVSEKDFGMENGFIVHTDMGDVALCGKIDRIDSVMDDGTRLIRIVDYKSGDKKLSLKDIYYGLNIQLVVYLMAALAYYRDKGEEAKALGGFYFRFQMPYTDDNEEPMDAFRMKGFILRDSELVKKMDAERAGKLKSMNFSLKDNGEDLVNYGGKSLIFDASEIDAIMNHVAQMVQNAVSSIYAGELSMYPVNKEDACKNCTYRTICRFDTDFDGNKKRYTDRLKREEILRKLCGRDQNG